jgi:ubiquitin-small subunit ribosomal protein S27Ae
MGKARTGFYSVKGDTLTRTHTFCPKCGIGVIMAIHPGPPPRRSCGKCGYAEAERSAPVPAPRAEKPAKGKGGPRPEKAAAPPAPPAAT